MRLFIFIFSVLFTSKGLAQFADSVGAANCSALHADSSAFIAWAKSCKVVRGYQDISNTNLGFASVGDSSMALSKADGAIVSLGDGGIATVTFSTPITNGTGYDFAVFENSFNGSFLELAFVEVSSDGINYFRFPSICNLPVAPQYDNNAHMEASKINNLAGKYRALYGTPFDLQELSSIPQLDVNSITHVRVIDVIGDINPPFATYDSQSHVINDPWPTPYPSSGFDLDAVGVINQKAVGINEIFETKLLNVYPNPAKNQLTIMQSPPLREARLEIRNLLGEIVLTDTITAQYQTITISALNTGVYFVSLIGDHENHTIKLLKE